MKVYQGILHRWTIYRINKAISCVRKRLPREDLEQIDSFLGEIVYIGKIVDDSVAGAGIYENGKYWIGFCLPHLWYKSREYLFVTVAHEFAHVFLEHKPKGELSEEEAEKAVSKQLEAWGIKEIYFTFYFPSKQNPLLRIDILP